MTLIMVPFNPIKFNHLADYIIYKSYHKLLYHTTQKYKNNICETNGGSALGCNVTHVSNFKMQILQKNSNTMYYKLY